jgi:hypothetical protein
MHSNREARDFFKANFNNKEILEILFEIALDKSENYSNDSRMEAAYYISQFSDMLLKSYEKELLLLQQEELESISCHIHTALARIKSKEGLKYLLEMKVEPVLYWEAEALKCYLSDFLSK